MTSTLTYTDAGRVCAALAFQAPETAATPISVGATSLTLNQTPPNDWQVGSTLVLDANNPTLRESVTITAPPNGSALTISATVNAHVVGAPAINATIVAPYVAASSRWFDTQTWTPMGWGYESVTETKEAALQKDGTLLIALSKPLVSLPDVTSASWKASPLASDTAYTLDLTQAWIENDFYLRIAPPPSCARKGMVTVTYSGGYAQVPDDITNAVTVMAARFYKERDSGYSDMIGNADTGLVSYKKAMPADVKTIVDMRKRWTR